MQKPQSALPDEILRAIGLLTIKFSYLEYILALKCGVLIGAKVPGAGNIITSEMSVSNLLALLSCLFKNTFKNQDVQNTAQQIIARIDQCSAKRNQIVHSIWTPEFDFVKEVKGEVVRRVKFTAKRKKGLDLQWENYSLDDLHAIVRTVEEVTQELDSFVDSVAFALGLADSSDAGKEYPMEIEPFQDENTGKTYFMPRLSEKEKDLMKQIEAYTSRLREEARASLEGSQKPNHNEK